MMSNRFAVALSTLPRPGGNGYHSRLLGVANIGIRAGFSPAAVGMALRQHTLPGGRRVPDREIADAVNKAAQGQVPRSVRKAMARWDRPCERVRTFDAAGFLAARLAEGNGRGEADIWEASPIRIGGASGEDATLLLENLYAPDEVLFIGSRYGRRVHTVAEWLARFHTGYPLPPHVIPNPLTGSCGVTKTGQPSFRSDDCVKSFRFAVAEFDNMSREEQLSFWWAVKLPVCALIDSGGKSLHAWIRIDGVATAETWTELVETRLFGDYLIPLGCDATCRNEARLSRLPGSFRAEKDRWQRLLYLAPEGRPIHAGS